MIFKLSLRNIFRHRGRSFFTLCAIVIGSIALVFAGGFFEDTYRQVGENIIDSYTGHLQVYKTGFSQEGAVEPFRFMLASPDELVENIKKINGVTSVGRRLPFSGILSDGENSVTCYAWGTDHPEKGLRLTKGEPLDQNKSNEVTLAQGLADSLGVSPRAGLILLTRTGTGSINGEDISVRGVFSVALPDINDYGLQLPVETAQRLLRTDGVQALVINLEETKQTQAVKQEIMRLAGAHNWDIEVKTWREINDTYDKTRALFSRWFLILNIIIVLIVVLIVTNTMTMSVFERSSEIGTLLAMGTRRRGVISLFVCEGLILGFLGGLAGLGAGVLVTLGAQQVGIVMPPPPGFSHAWFARPMVVPTVLVSTFLISLLTVVLSSLWPARKAAHLEIAEALRYAG